MTTTQVDRLNIGLIIAAFLAAFFWPYETFVLAYAYLGPLHYLTQISWLHDRKYFLESRKLAIFLIVPAVLWVVAFLELYPFTYPERALFVWVSIVAALAFTLTKSLTQRMWLVAILLFVGFLLTTKLWWVVFLLTFIPSIVHVFIFTALFMLFGAMKSRSVAGFLAVGLLLCLGVLIVLLPAPSILPPFSPFLEEGTKFFHDLQLALAEMFHLPLDEAGQYRVMRLVGFSYLYHYLNWFSKTKVIGWGEVSRKRGLGIVGAYLILIGIYTMNFTVGFLSALALATAHVFLEFPLNVHSVKGVIGGVIGKSRSERPLLGGVD